VEELEMAANVADGGQLPRWRLSGIGFLRILFGIVWAIDAWFGCSRTSSTTSRII
jgi:hypothetical protein